MISPKIMTGCMACVLLFLNAHADDWDAIWQPTIARPKTVSVGELGELGADLENREWQMISTEYHEIYYQPSTNIGKVATVYSLIDNVYDFLKGRSPAQPRTPIKVFLVPGQGGRSRCSKANNAMRTGDQGDAQFILASLLHEETHLFNFAFLDGATQGWWTGEFTCIYYQQRALWMAQGKDIKKEILSRLTDGPRCRLMDIEKRGKEAFDEAFAALYFFEEHHGREKSNSFRQACLKESKKTNGGPLPVSVFAEAFGQDIDRFEQEWLQFYGWRAPGGRTVSDVRDLRLKTKISYSVDKASVQNAVQAMASKAGLRYNFAKSKSQTDPLCRSWVRNILVSDRPLHEALVEILDPHELTYKLEEGAIVLYRK